MTAWSSGDSYDGFIGRWSRRIAPRMVEWIDAPTGLRWIDVGCGTGALTAAILSGADPTRVIGVDPSAAYLEEANRRLADPRVTLLTGDAESLPADQDLDVAVSGLVLTFVPDPHRAVAAMRSAVRPGGTVASYLWDYKGRMEVLRYFWDAASALDDAALARDEGARATVADPARLHDLWQAAGLADVTTAPLEAEARFVNFDDYWLPFLNGQGPAGTYTAALAEPQRDALRDTLRDSLPTAPDGSVTLTIRAWAVKGVIP